MYVCYFFLLTANIAAWGIYKWGKSKQLGVASAFILCLSLATSLLGGLLLASDLRGLHLNPRNPDFFNAHALSLYFRYFLLAGMVLSLWSFKRTITQFQILDRKVYEFILHLTCVWYLTSELIHILELLESENSYKLGISILWGTYSLFLIIIGIWRKNQGLRIGAFSLFALTLVKLFFYDIANMSTISKTIVFVALGLLLLVISFLYNKFKARINE